MRSEPSPAAAELPSGDAPGGPGLAPTFTTSDKDMVGCALGAPRLWYTLGHGIVDEVYYPRIDIPQIRDLGFIVADDAGFWAEVKRLDARSVWQPDPGVPIVRVVHRHPRFELVLRVCPDPDRDVLLVEFALDGDEALRPYALLAPHLGGTGWHNEAWAGLDHGRRLLSAVQGPFALALAAVDDQQNEGLGAMSAGIVGESDGWQDFSRNGRMAWRHAHAGPGNVALMGALPRRGTLALGFAASPESAGTLARAALAREFGSAWAQVEREWLAWHATGAHSDSSHAGDELPAELAAARRGSAMVLRVHMDKTFPGAMVASLSIPWGSQGQERGGYHLVWPRDLVECAGALLAMGAQDDAREVLRYLIATQQADGRWLQNQWLGGSAYWAGDQLDETGFPVLLAAALTERQALNGMRVTSMVRGALSYLVSHGPASDQDRWEEDAGLNPFTLAVCIAALVAGADLLDGDDHTLALLAADYWNSRIEDWTVAVGGPLARRFGVSAYYVREAPTEVLGDAGALRARLAVKNRFPDPGLSADGQVGTDFLQLVRFGLRKPDDPLIVQSLAVLDGMLRVDTPVGPVWHRYNGDGYGEHEDGRPFDGTGIGRGWPLLTGERGHYELSAGRDPLPYLGAMVSMSGGLGLMPEQVWDGPAIPERFLFPGRPSGSAMPLAWAHAEFLKLAASRSLGRPIDRPQAVWRRYAGRRPEASHALWTERSPITRIPRGQALVLAFGEPVMLHCGNDGWRDAADTASRPIGLGLHGLVLAAETLERLRTLEFTWRRPDGRWAGRDYSIAILSPAAPPG